LLDLEVQQFRRRALPEPVIAGRPDTHRIQGWQTNQGFAEATTDFLSAPQENIAGSETGALKQTNPLGHRDAIVANGATEVPWYRGAVCGRNRETHSDGPRTALRFLDRIGACFSFHSPNPSANFTSAMPARETPTLRPAEQSKHVSESSTSTNVSIWVTTALDTLKTLCRLVTTLSAYAS